MSGDSAVKPATAGAGRASPEQRGRVARLFAVQGLYQIELSAAQPETVIQDLLAYSQNEGDEPALAEPDPGLMGRTVRGALTHAGELDPLIDGALADDWPLKRLEAVMRAVLRAGTYELRFEEDMSPRETIREYVEIAKAFYADKEPAMVNAVLDTIARRLRGLGDNDPLS